MSGARLGLQYYLSIPIHIGIGLHDLGQHSYFPLTFKLAEILWAVKQPSPSSGSSSEDMPVEGRATVFYPPPVTPQFCFSTTALKQFLRLSRSAIDDTITQNLNVLNTPASFGFSPSSTAYRNVPPPRHLLPLTACQDFTKTVLFPSWSHRSDVLNYCSSVASSGGPGGSAAFTNISETEEHKVVNERLDPYSGRSYPQETRVESLAEIVRNERVVEEIIRERTWRVVGERCGGFDPVGGQDWREVFGNWEQSNKPADR